MPLSVFKKHFKGASIALAVFLLNTAVAWAAPITHDESYDLQRRDLPAQTEQLPALPQSDSRSLSLITDADDVRIEGAIRDGRPIEILHLPDQETLELEVPLDSPELAETQLSPEQVDLAREDARKILELTLKGALSNEFTGDISTAENGPTIGLQPDDPNTSKKVSGFFKRIFFSQGSDSPSLNRRVSEKFKQSIRAVWKFVFVETAKAGVDYYRQFKKNRSRFTEFGIALDIKLEPQVFISKFNLTKKIKLFSRSYALFLEISYSRTAKRVMVRTRYRREKGTGGLGLPALKAEFKFFESDGNRGTYRGKSWYPVSPPLVSFVFDSSSHYFAQGITVGFNSGDLVPGSTLTNTFTEFVQTDNTRQVLELPGRASHAAVNAAGEILGLHPAVRSCRQLILN